MELSNIQHAIFATILKYVERQKIALEAIIDLRPDIWILTSGENLNEELIKRTEVSVHTPQSGHWGTGKEWSYFIHGLGIRLLHTITQEPIEWDAPDINTFDRYWFVNYVEWLLNQHSEEQTLSTIRTSLVKNGDTMQANIFQILDQLVLAGILSGPYKTNKYTVISDE